ncbi:MAG: hypothetical protein ACRC4W_03275 [Treponemataceae bacterium]
MKLLQDVYWFFKGVTVYALVGESGTGKSFRSKLLAQKYNIDFIIDDGLLIKDDKIVAGHTAKREKTFLGAVRVALFDDKPHRDEVAKALKKYKATKILLLGTSDKMVHKIAQRLQLPQPSKIIRIEDIATRDEIDKAIRSRKIEGKHVIPVPSIEVKKNYPRIFYDSVKVFLKKRKIPFLLNNKEKTFEKSVVCPAYSQKGNIVISEAALSQMIIHCVCEFDSEIKVKKLTIKTDNMCYKIVLAIDVPFGLQLTGRIHSMQNYIIDNIEKYTGILLEEFDIVIDKITQTDKAK